MAGIAQPRNVPQGQLSESGLDTRLPLCDWWDQAECSAEADQAFRIAALAALLPVVLTLTYILFLLKCRKRSRVVLPLGSEKELDTKEFKVKFYGKE